MKKIEDNKTEQNYQTFQEESKYCQKEQITIQNQERFELQAPRQIVDRAYSLTPDMIGGWKPKNIQKMQTFLPFSIQYQDSTTQLIVSRMARKRKGVTQKLVYLGSRKMCSVSLHSNRSYRNPYGSISKLTVPLDRRSIRESMVAQQSFLSFDGDFESGNLDLVLEVGSNQFDLYTRVDTNTRGHNLWYYFTIQNGEYQGKVKLNICNFRRQMTLYQKGMRPYIKSAKGGGGWSQGGKNITYTKLRKIYSFCDENEPIQGKYFMLSFQYQFRHTDDTVSFAYCVPYTYSQMLQHLQKLENVQKLQPLRSLSGLDIPIVKVTNQDVAEQNKIVVMVTGRVHPGESNGSFVMESILSTLNEGSSLARQLKNKFIFYIIPMLNPDGVVAGNYRTSLFGKDLNRTYNYQRRYAFPETYNLMQFAKKLKAKYKKGFCLYIDIHGHSNKQNSFIYGPQHNIQSANYELSRQLPRIMGKITHFFRYYACSFRVVGKKESTSRAVFCKEFNIPFSYTLENSNGSFYDYDSKISIEGGVDVWKKMGIVLCMALAELPIDSNIKLKKQITEKITKRILSTLKEKRSLQREDISDSDCDSDSEDLSEEILFQLQQQLTQGKIKREHIKTEKSSLNSFKPKDLFLQSKDISLELKIPRKVDSRLKISRETDFRTELNMASRNLKKKEVLPPINSVQDCDIFGKRLQSKETLFKSIHSKRYEMGREMQWEHQKLPKPIIMIREMDEGSNLKGRRSYEKKVTRKKVLPSFFQRLKTIK